MRAFGTPWRASGAAGLSFVTLSFVAIGVNVQLPSYEADPAALVAWFAQHGQRFRWGHCLAGLAFLCFYLPFFAGLCERLRCAEGDPGIGSRVAWAGAIISPAVGSISGAFAVGTALVGGDISADVARLGMAASFYARVVSGALSSAVMMGAALVIVRTSAFRPWLGWTGASLSVAAIAGTGAIVEGDPLGLFAMVSDLAWLAYFVWLAALSIALMRAPNVPAPPSAIPS